MKYLLFPLIITMTISHSTAQEIKMDSLENYVHQLMEDFEVPGLTIGIVRDDSLLFAKGFGTCEANYGTPVNENTLFGIGSISKSFVALTIGILVDEGKLGWDDRVAKYIPEFELYDPWVTAHFTIRDLLTHRSGLPQVSGGTLVVNTDFSRKEIIDKLKYLKPESEFRYNAAYQNVMFIVAAEIVARVSGMEWEAFVEKHVFGPLEMETSVARSADREASTNLAKPHIMDDEGRPVQIEQERSDNVTPAGFIFSTAKDMSNYMRMLLNGGTFKGERIISPHILEEIFTPQNHYSVLPPPFHNKFTSYGMGWWVTPRNDRTLIEHSGGIDGASSNLIMARESNFGVVAMVNNNTSAAMVLTHEVISKALGDEAYVSRDLFLSFLNMEKAMKKEEMDKIERSRVDNTKPSLDLASYAGTYQDRMYGDILIRSNDNGSLLLDLPRSRFLKGELEHWHYDTFRVNWKDIRIPDGFITFKFNVNQEVTGFGIEQKNLLDVDFSELDIRKKE